MNDLQHVLSGAEFVLFDSVYPRYLAWFGGGSTYIHVYDSEGREFGVFSTDRKPTMKNMLSLAMRRIKSREGYPG